MRRLKSNFTVNALEERLALDCSLIFIYLEVRPALQTLLVHNEVVFVAANED